MRDDADRRHDDRSSRVPARPWVPDHVAEDDGQNGAGQPQRFARAEPAYRYPPVAEAGGRGPYATGYGPSSPAWPLEA